MKLKCIYIIFLRKFNLILSLNIATNVSLELKFCIKVVYILLNMPQKN